MVQESPQDEQEQVTEKKKAEQRSRFKSSHKSHLDFRKYTKQIWLAGLGAFSRAEEEGNKLFDSLVKVGEELESKSTDVNDAKNSKVTHQNKESVSEKKDKDEKISDQGVNHPLNRIGLVTVKDIHNLENLILELHHKVDALVEENQKLKSKLDKN